MNTPEFRDHGARINTERNFLELQVQRRQFLIASILSPVLLACTKESHSNLYSLENLKKELGITSSTTRNEFAEKSPRIVLENPSWMVGKTVAYKTDLGKTVLWRIDEKGEPKAANFEYKSTIAYPDSRVPGFKEETVIYSYPNNRHVVIYGITDTIKRISEHKDLIQTFTEEYFQGITTPAIFHLIFLPRSDGMELVDIGDYAKVKLKANSVASANMPIIDNKILRFDVAVVIPGIHFEASNTATSNKRKLINALSNEAVSVLFSPIVRPKVGATAHVPQAITSVAGMIAEVDDSFAKMILGGRAYDKFCDVVVQEMQRIGQVKISK